MLLILLCGVMLTLKATGQSGDVIRLEGEEWVLMAKPIGYDSLLCRRMGDFLPENVTRSTGNYSGYTAFWEVRDGYLCLQRVEADFYDEVSKKEYTRMYEVKDLRPIFAAYCLAGTIQARWFSGELRAGKGDVVRYVHDGFDRNMETERVLTVRSGKVLETQTYHNYRRAGLNLTKAQGEIVHRFPWKRFPEYRGERIRFSLSDFQLTADGHFIDCDVRFIYLRSSQEMINDGNHPLALALKETLKSIYPWEVLFINGKYTSEYRNLTITLRGDITHNKGDSAKYTTGNEDLDFGSRYRIIIIFCMHIKRIRRKRTADRNIPYHRFQHHRHRLRRSVCRSFRIRLLCCKRIIRYFRTLYCWRSLLCQNIYRLCLTLACTTNTHHTDHRHKQLKKCICFHTLLG